LYQNDITPIIQPNSPTLRLNDGSSVEFHNLTTSGTDNTPQHKQLYNFDAHLYINFMSKVSLKQGFYSIVQFASVSALTVIMFGYLPAIVSYTRMIFSPYFAYKVAAKPIFKEGK